MALGPRGAAGLEEVARQRTRGTSVRRRAVTCCASSSAVIGWPAPRAGDAGGLDSTRAFLETGHAGALRAGRVPWRRGLGSCGISRDGRCGRLQGACPPEMRIDFPDDESMRARTRRSTRPCTSRAAPTDWPVTGSVCPGARPSCTDHSPGRPCRTARRAALWLPRRRGNQPRSQVVQGVSGDSGQYGLKG